MKEFIIIIQFKDFFRVKYFDSFLMVHFLLFLSILSNPFLFWPLSIINSQKIVLNFHNIEKKIEITSLNHTIDSK